MTSKDIIKQILEKWRFPIVQETESVIVIRFQMNFIQIGSLQDDTKSMAVTLADIFKADDDREYRLALKTCNEINYKMMQTKLYLDDENSLSIASEFFYYNEEDVEYLLNLALQSVITGKKHFIQQYEAFVDEDNLIRELERE